MESIIRFESLGFFFLSSHRFPEKKKKVLKIFEEGPSFTLPHAVNSLSWFFHLLISTSDESLVPVAWSLGTLLLCKKSNDQLWKITITLQLLQTVTFSDSDFTPITWLVCPQKGDVSKVIYFPLMAVAEQWAHFQVGTLYQALPYYVLWWEIDYIQICFSKWYIWISRW